MRPLEELGHYEVLELPHGAAFEEIETAYRTLKATYATNSLAIYSLLDASDADFVRERIQEAYRVLSDEEERHRYDLQLAGEPVGDEVEPVKAAVVLDRPAIFESEPPALGSEAPLLEESPTRLSPARRDEFEFNGASLRRERLRRELDVDQLAEITKISPNYLRCIEEERFEELPAAVYVRGFVGAYARALGLDAVEVSSRYTARLEAGRASPKRSRLLDRN